MLKQPQQGKLPSPPPRLAIPRGRGARQGVCESREERQKVMIKARMRSGVSWRDVCILNLSVHGVGIQAAEPPARGTYVEIRRGSQVIVARVAWAKGHRAGLRSQDAIFIQSSTTSARPHRLPGLSEARQSSAAALRARPRSGTTAAGWSAGRRSSPASFWSQLPWR